MIRIMKKYISYLFGVHTRKHFKAPKRNYLPLYLVPTLRWYQPFIHPAIHF